MDSIIGPVFVLFAGVLRRRVHLEQLLGCFSTRIDMGVRPRTDCLSFALIRCRGSLLLLSELLLSEGSEGSGASSTDLSSASRSCTGVSSVASSAGAFVGAPSLPVFVETVFVVPAAVFVTVVVVTFPFDFLVPDLDVFFLYASNSVVIFARAAVAPSSVNVPMYTSS